MTDWSAQQYLKFEDERTRAARDLLAHVPLTQARRVADLGCGPGNSTELLAQRWPDATLIGIDTSADMLKQARERLPQVKFVEANISHWAPPEETDVLFANAVFQWVPDHIRQLQRLLKALPKGGVLALQMPDNLYEPSHVAMRELALAEPWREKLTAAVNARAVLPNPVEYYDALRPLCSHLDVWHTIYNHVLDGPEAIVEWVKGTGLRPFLDPLDFPERKAFLAAYTEQIALAYPPLHDGKVMLRFPRLFLICVR